MKKSLALFAMMFVVSIGASAMEAFPKGPDQTLTPGDLCHRPDTYRYPERVAYCERNVSSDEKREIFSKYDQLGFRTRSMNRADFKIDHYIPLCAGGSNDESNLWPQHKTIYVITDDLEALICEKMSAGRLLQKDAVTIIVEAKNNLDRVPSIMARVRAL